MVKNLTASIKQKLRNIAREKNQPLEIIHVHFGMERLLYRLSKSPYAENFILKGGALVTLWLENDNRVTRDIDLLGYGEASIDHLKKIFTEIMDIDGEDGLKFDTEALSASSIREAEEYGGTRLKTVAYLDNTRIHITIDIAFGDALPKPAQVISYPALLDMASPEIRAYPPATVIAEKFQAIVDLGIANGRMKDYFDLWNIPLAMSISEEELDAAITATFTRRKTEIPKTPPAGLTSDFYTDTTTITRWKSYSDSIGIENIDLETVVNDIWHFLEKSCLRCNSDN